MSLLLFQCWAYKLVIVTVFTTFFPFFILLIFLFLVIQWSVTNDQAVGLAANLWQAYFISQIPWSIMWNELAWTSSLITRCNVIIWAAAIPTFPPWNWLQRPAVTCCYTKAILWPFNSKAGRWVAVSHHLAWACLETEMPTYKPDKERHSYGEAWHTSSVYQIHRRFCGKRSITSRWWNMTLQTRSIHRTAPTCNLQPLRASFLK
jgi:hypothetical protein